MLCFHSNFAEKIKQMEHRTEIGFADIAVQKRKVKEDFFKQINILINWEEIDKFIKRYYEKGFSVDGRPPYSGLLLFKICLLQTWYGLSDYEVEDQVNERISFNRCMDDKSPDNTAISRFRTAISQTQA